MTERQEKKRKGLFDFFKKNAKEEDVDKIAQDLDGMNKGPIAEIWDQVQKLWRLIKDVDVAWSAKTIAIGALLYLISPIDAIPDIIPFLGLTDDVLVITAAIAALKSALDEYEE